MMLEFTLPSLRKQILKQIIKIMLIFIGIAFLLLICIGIIEEQALHWSILKIVTQTISFPKRIFILAFIMLCIGVWISLYLAEKLEQNIAKPLRTIAQILQFEAKLSKRLKFPAPTNLEIKVLILELNRLWDRIRELHSSNIKNLAIQEINIKAIFAALSDAVIFINIDLIVQYCNQGFLDIINIANDSIIIGQRWDDLSLMTKPYLQLREFLLQDKRDKEIFTWLIADQYKIYHVHKQNIFAVEQNQIGFMLSLKECDIECARYKVKSNV